MADARIDPHVVSEMVEMACRLGVRVEFCRVDACSFAGYFPELVGDVRRRVRRERGQPPFAIARTHRITVFTPSTFR